MVSEQTPVIVAEDLAKHYGGIFALKGVSLELHPGEVHALCGENGAGKSTLIKILGGATSPDAGRVFVTGSEQVLRSPARSLELGIHTIYQELHLVPYLDITQNVFLGEEITRGAGWLDSKRMDEETRQLLAIVGAGGLDPHTAVEDLRAGEQQLVEIAKALHGDARVLIMDEPTASLTQREKESLFEVIANLKARGIAVLYVSHLLDEVFRVADRVTVLRDGSLVNSVPISATSIPEVTSWMLGKAMENQAEEGRAAPGEELLRVEGLTQAGAFADVSFSLRAGEVLGLVGLIGSGRTEIARTIFGLDPLDGGTVYLNGKPVRISSPEAAVKAGIALVPEDRKRQGLVLGRSIVENLSLAAIGRFQRAGWIRRRAEARAAAVLSRDLSIKSDSISQPVEALSGGNQQKVVLGKWLAGNANIFLLDEPTHGVDVGAKAEIGRIIRRLCLRGAGVILISSDLDEILNLSDRVLVIRSGRVVREFQRGAVDRGEILAALLGSSPGGSDRDKDHAS